MHSALNALSGYTYFCMPKHITSYTFSLIFKIVESLQCILKFALESSKLPFESSLLEFERLLFSLEYKNVYLMLCVGLHVREFKMAPTKRRSFCKEFKLKVTD